MNRNSGEKKKQGGGWGRSEREQAKQRGKSLLSQGPLNHDHRTKGLRLKKVTSYRKPNIRLMGSVNSLICLYELLIRNFMRND